MVAGLGGYGPATIYIEDYVKITGGKDITA
jgi:hypothetical protein